MLHGELTERIQIDHAKRRILSGIELDARHAQGTDLAAAVGRVCLKPALRTQTPATAALQPNSAQIVAARGRVVQELVGHHGRDGVVARVLVAACPAVSVPKIASHRLLGEQLKRLFEDCSVMTRAC
jgi:hypothetical protein